MNSNRKIKSGEVEEIMDKKVVNGRPRYLVKWRRRSENTWESAEDFSPPDIIQQFEEKLRTGVIQDRGSNIRSSAAKPERTLNINSGGRIKPGEVEEIVDKKVVNGRLRYLVKWRRRSEVNTWEPAEDFSTPDIIQKFEEKLQLRVIQNGRSNIRSSAARPERTLNESKSDVVTKSKIPAVKTTQAQKIPTLSSTPETEKMKNSFLNLVKSEFQCSICHDIFQEASVTNCGHIFCSGCIEQWKHESDACPICRVELVGGKKVFDLNNFLEKANNLLGEKK